MRNKEKWSRWHKYGKSKFVFFYAVFWAVLVSVGSIIIKEFFNDFKFNFSVREIVTEVLIRSLINFVFGIFMGRVTWNNNEKEYQKYINE